MSLPTPIHRIVPRSILRHRPIGSQSPEEPPLVPRASRTRVLPPQTEDPHTTEPPRQSLPPRRSDGQVWWTNKSLLLGLGMLVALSGLFLVQLTTNRLSTLWDDIQYGRPRTFHIEAFVGHETGKSPSHFIGMNIHGRVEVVEFPGGDMAHPLSYIGPQLSGPNADLIPVTLHFVDTSHNGHPDMIIQFQGLSIELHNEQGRFVSEEKREGAVEKPFPFSSATENYS